MVRHRPWTLSSAQRWTRKGPKWRARPRRARPAGLGRKIRGVRSRRRARGSRLARWGGAGWGGGAPGGRGQLAGGPRAPVRADERSPIVMRLREAFSEVTGDTLQSGGADGHEAYTDASMIAALTESTTCTVFGPGSSDVAHTADEYVDIDDIEVAS